MARKTMAFSDEIRLAVDASGLSRYRIAKILGCTESSMSRFMNGAMLRQPHLDNLAKLLDLHVSRGPGFGKHDSQEK
jgi:transcriptional regulator with XRE-family HTH domain